MASRLLKMAQSKLTALKSAFFPTRPAPPPMISPFPELNSRVQELMSSLNSNIASIQSSFVAPDHPEIHNSIVYGSGVCVDPTLVVTTAHNVGRIRPSQSQTIAGGHKAYIGSTTVLTLYGPVKMRPVAVNFASDIAVLKVVKSEETALLHACPLSVSPPEKENILISVNCVQSHKRLGISMANVRAVGRKTIPAKAPWPLNDELGWIEHDWLMFNRGPAPPSSFLFGCKEKASGSMTKISGSPWFNLHGELVGVASWVLRDDDAGFSVGYMAPLSSIVPVIDYAKARGADESAPVVMDRWINNVVNAYDDVVVVDDDDDGDDDDDDDDDDDICI